MSEYDPRLDQDFGDIVTADVFDGDIVNAYYQDPKAEWVKEGETPKPKLVLKVRDWERSEGRDEPFIRTSRLTVSTDRRSMLTKLRKEIQQKLGIMVGTPKQFIGLAAHWSIQDVPMGKFTASDVLGCEGKAESEMPGDLPAYVPRTRDGESEGAESLHVAAEAPVATVSDEAKDAFLSDILTGPMDASAIQKATSKNAGFRTKYPLAFASLVSGSLLDTLVEEGKLTVQGGVYARA